MFPILFTIGEFKFYTFGLFLVIAILWGSYQVWRLAKLTIYKEEQIFDMLFFSLLISLTVGRLAYVLTHIPLFSTNWLKVFLVHAYPGISAPVVLLTFLLVFYYSCIRNKVQFEQIIDVLMSPLATSVAIVKLGAFFAGSEIGAKTNFLLSVKYFGFDGQRHIVAVYEALLFALLSYILYEMLLRVRRGVLPKGITLPVAVFGYAAINLASYPLLDASVKPIMFNVQIMPIVWSLALLTSMVWLVYTLKPWFSKLLKRK